MANLIASIIFFGSFIGMGIIAAKKVAVLSETLSKSAKDISLFGRVMDKTIPGIQKRFSLELILQKLLSKFRVLTLKTEHRIGSWLSFLRQRSMEKEKKLSGTYWDKIKRKK